MKHRMKRIEKNDYDYGDYDNDNNNNNKFIRRSNMARVVQCSLLVLWKQSVK